ncbi:twin-arginine translocation signal domain-containing protein [Streptomyces sp. NPDC005423]|uniref:twin-arginine translocation signal domain-containing protein n=1 Tax=Streptomyces sp. NPDC005423 TaxID=3155343 RepID=UPI0033A13CCB
MDALHRRDFLKRSAATGATLSVTAVLAVPAVRPRTRPPPSRRSSATSTAPTSLSTIPARVTRGPRSASW